MSGALNSELSNFHSFIAEQLKVAHSDVSPEEALDLWRSVHPLPDAEDDAVAAVQEALHDMESGDQGVLLEEFDRGFRQHHGLGTK